ncbi:MAG: SDR family NAD(P)-dependent oxidoreductase [Hyphomicrobiaceae bacterium]|nr:SDR family NAD(P)-dependent oxidoreductase [Hyphomicrobiaceae bacterium]MCC0009411.1 SDR family NAD(P)-dependent oxidoreductase [Hyphomicrobiaceae bacterium]
MNLDKTISAVVTGGASGLGGACVRRLAAQGVRVSIFDLNEQAGNAIAGEVGGAFFKTDVADEVSVEASLAAARSHFGQERILVNCAGIVIGKRSVRRDRQTSAVVAHDLASFRKVIDINLIGTFLMSTRSAAGMMELAPLGPDKERGVIISTSSVAAEDGQMGQIAYAASKGGVLSMTLPLARDLASDGVRVVAIQPGLFSTPMFDTLTDEAKASLAAQVPFPSRLGDPDEYGQLVVQIAQNVMLNGCGIRLDGGLRLSPR